MQDIENKLPDLSDTHAIIYKGPMCNSEDMKRMIEEQTRAQAEIDARKSEPVT